MGRDTYDATYLLGVGEWKIMKNKGIGGMGKGKEEKLHNNPRVNGLKHYFSGG